jgi:hypothetical protein
MFMGHLLWNIMGLVCRRFCKLNLWEPSLLHQEGMCVASGIEGDLDLERKNLLVTLIYNLQ